jgi:hypothetical protein
LDEGSLTKQMLSMILENNALKDTVYPYIISYLVFNIIILVLMIYISIRISLR